jgi:hypothetical protein
MDDLSHKLEELQIAHVIERIDLLISQLRQSSYISSTTRLRTVELFRHELKISLSTAENMDKIASLSLIQKYFSQSTAKYIPRNIVRLAIMHLVGINQRKNVSPKDQTNWNEQEWFHHLVDYDTVVQPLRDILDSLGVCRYRVVSSMCNIVLFGRFDDKKFFDDLRVTDVLSLSMMDPFIARCVFKYSGGFTMEGSLDCAQYFMT